MDGTPFGRRVRTRVALAALAVLSPALAAAGQASSAAAISGTTTTSAGAVALPGVAVVLVLKGAETIVARTTSGDGGRFEVTKLAAGSYQLRASLTGFAPVARDLRLDINEHAAVSLNLEIATISEHVDVVGRGGVAAADNASTRAVVSGRLIDLAPLPDDKFESLLPLVPGVVRDGFGHVSMKGGRPSQSGLQVNGASASDPATGDWGYALPAEAVETVDVLPNPYAADIGRFSSGVAQIQTRKGTNEWRPTVNSVVPILKFHGVEPAGLRWWNPRVALAGPLVKDRLFMLESAEYEIGRTPVGDLPDGANEVVLHRVNSFTRLDAVLGARHWLTGTVAVFPSRIDYLGLSPFSPRAVSPTSDQHGVDANISEASSLGQHALLESAMTVRRYDVTIDPRDRGPMEIAPAGRTGSFFNAQQRQTRSAQWTEKFTTERSQGRAQHVFSAGLDVLQATLDGTSESQPVILRRSDGTIAQRLDFTGPATQHVSSTEVAAYGQDRWRASDRVLVESGLRWDRDGVLHRSNWAPRVGAAIQVLAHGRGVVRGGAGVFYGRTPLNVGAFGSYETPMLTRFAADGATPVAPPVPIAQQTAAGLRTPRSVTWNVEYDHQITPAVTMRVNYFDRRGSHEALLEPADSAGAFAWRLDDRGRSRYRETEVTVHYGPRPHFDLSASYVYSRSEADLNAFDSFFSNIRNPIVRPNEFGPTPIDAPHRLLIQGSVPVTPNWSLSPLIEVRTGFPYSIVNQDQDFIGRRNIGQRFPVFATADLSLNRLIKFRHRESWISLRIYHVLNSFTPRDVQNNIDSPAFGTFYNGIPRRLGLGFFIVP